MVTRNAEAQRRRRAALARLGLCQLCGKAPPRPDKVDCQLCFDETAARIKDRRAAFDELDLCRDCGAEELETVTRCPRCAERSRIASRASEARARLRRRVLPGLVLWLHWRRRD